MARSLLDHDVVVAGINLMTMNFGGSRPGDDSMGAASIEALRAAQRQLHGLLQQRGELIELEAVWPRLGATPMIGQNDVAEDRFSLDDAHRLADFAADVGLGRLSMWSVNRDGPCSAQLRERPCVQQLQRCGPGAAGVRRGLPGGEQ